MCLEYMDGECDPRLEHHGFDFLHPKCDINVALDFPIIGHSGRSEIHRDLVSLQLAQDCVDSSRENESEIILPKTKDDIQNLVYLNTIRRLVVSILDDTSIPEAYKRDMFELLKDRYGMDDSSFDDFLISVGKREDNEGETHKYGRDELYVRDLCMAFIGTNLHPTSAATANLCTRIAHNFHKACPPLIRGLSAPIATIELADANTWLLTAYYPTPMQHRLFLGVPLELESPTGLRCRVCVRDLGSPTVNIVA